MDLDQGMIFFLKENQFSMLKEKSDFNNYSSYYFSQQPPHKLGWWLELLYPHTYILVPSTAESYCYPQFFNKSIKWCWQVSYNLNILSKLLQAQHGSFNGFKVCKGIFCPELLNLSLKRWFSFTCRSVRLYKAILSNWFYVCFLFDETCWWVVELKTL